MHVHSAWFPASNEYCMFIALFLNRSFRIILFFLSFSHENVMWGWKPDEVTTRKRSEKAKPIKIFLLFWLICLYMAKNDRLVNQHCLLVKCIYLLFWFIGTIIDILLLWFLFIPFHLQIYCILIWGWKFGGLFNHHNAAFFIGTFSQLEFNEAHVCQKTNCMLCLNIDNEPVWNDNIVEDIQGWGMNIFSKHSWTHTLVWALAEAGITQRAHTNSGIYPSSDLTHVMAPPLHSIRLTSLFPLRVL